METRKIVKSGNTSFTLALPIQWIRKNHLDKGSSVSIGENDYGDLLISSENRVINAKEEMITIKVDGKDNDAVGLEFLIAYIRDYPTIILEGKELRSKITFILNRVKSYIGVDVIDQSINALIVKNFFTLDRETAPHVIAKKIGLVNHAIFDILQSFFTRGLTKDDLGEIIRLKEQNERLFNLVKKSTLKIIEDPSLLKIVQTDSLQVVKDRINALSLRNISSDLTDIGSAFLLLENTKKEVTPYRAMFEAVSSNYKELIKMITSKDSAQVMQFIKKSSSEIAHWRRSAKEYEDPLFVECVQLTLSVSLMIEDVAYQIIE